MTHMHHQTLRQKLARLIYTNKRIAPSRVLAQSFDEIGFDTVDLVDIILEVEKAYHITIPDEVPLHTVDDFVYFISQKSD